VLRSYRQVFRIRGLSLRCCQLRRSLPIGMPHLSVLLLARLTPVVRAAGMIAGAQ